MKQIPLLLITDRKEFVRNVVTALSTLAIDVLESEPTYTSYLKVLQYLPAIIIIELPKSSHNQLHFLQMVKQNSASAAIPVIGFGAPLAVHVLDGLKKIGLTHYLQEPLVVKELVMSLLARLRDAGFPVRKKKDPHPSEGSPETGILLAIDTPREEKIESMIKHVNAMMAFPFTLAVAMQQSHKSDCGIAELARIIEADPVISVHFLKRANTAHFTGANSRIGTIRDAIVRIGLNETRQMISGMAVMQLFDTQASSYGFDRVKFWKHCLAVAIIAEQLARAGGMADPQDAFLAGMLHDFGIMIMDEYFPSLFGNVLKLSTDKGIGFYAAEQALLQIDHTEVVSRLFTVWKMPEEVTNAVVYHYHAVSTDSSSLGAADPIAVITGIANVMAKSYNLGMSCDQQVTVLSNALFEAIGIVRCLPDGFKEKVLKQYSDYSRLISIETMPPAASPAAVPLHMHRTIGIVDMCNYVFNPVRECLVQAGYTLVTLNAPYSNRDGCEIVLVFPKNNVTNTNTDIATVESLCRAIPATPGNEPHRKALPVVYISKSPMVGEIVKKFPQVSILPPAMDARLLPSYIENIIHGTVVQVSLGEGSQRSNAKNRSDSPVSSIQMVFKEIQMYREKCLTGSVENEFCREAARLMMEAQQRYGNNGPYPEDVELLFKRVSQLYRKAWLIDELQDCDAQIKACKGTVL